VLFAMYVLLGKSTISTKYSTPNNYGSISDLVLPNKMNSALPESEVSVSNSSERMVTKDTNLSLKVKDVKVTLDKIDNKTKEMNGYMVNSSMNQPGEVVSGNITIRVPTEKRDEMIKSLGELAVKVVSESVYGRDVTDQYTDIETRLKILESTKNKYQEIINRAIIVGDILSAQRELMNLQIQIDNLKGSKKYLEESVKLTRIAVYLSTDELALPYAPDNEWRPMQIFKEAVRSMVGVARSIGSLIIYVIVFLPVLIPIGVIIWIVRKKKLEAKNT